MQFSEVPHAPLAETDISDKQELTLEAIQAMHQPQLDKGPETLAELPVEESTLVLSDVKESIEPVVEASEEPSVEPETDAPLLEAQVEESESDLHTLLHFDAFDTPLDLSKKDDIQYIELLASELFGQDLAHLMEKSVRLWDAQAKTQNIYAKLERLSRERADLQEIIRTAQEAEHFKALLERESIDAQSIHKARIKLNQLQDILGRYQSVLTLLEDV